MSEDDRIARLEQRLQVLETLVREQLAGRASVPPPAPVAERPFAPVPSVAAVNPPREPPPPPPLPAPPVVRPPGRSIEEWLGQRGLLAVGVTFVVLAAGYLLKLSFDRGWVSPLARCIGGALTGGLVGALGWRLHNRGTKTYGAALIGAGAAIIYLSVWAAARLYGFLTPTPALLGLALVSVALAAIAIAINLEALAATAAIGAFLAPLVLGDTSGSPSLLLLYLAAMAVMLGAVAAQRRWRWATFVIALAYFGHAGSSVFRSAPPPLLGFYGVLGGAAALAVALRERWRETRFLAFAGGWSVLWIAQDAGLGSWPTLLGAVTLAAPVWWRALTSRTIWPDVPGDVSDRPSLLESCYFYLSPMLVGYALYAVAPNTFAAHDGLVPLLVALPYLAVGFGARHRPFAIVGVIALATAVLAEWHSVESGLVLLLLVHLWAALDHLLVRDDGRWYALGTYLLAVVLLLQRDLPNRAPSEPAFLGLWALALWGCIETAVVLAAGLLKPQPSGRDRELRPLLWSAAGVLLLFGMTGELVRGFRLSDLPSATASLAGGLSVSAWWICFAGACFIGGFRRQIRALRLAGFAVAALALLKVIFVDLSTLSAFYRVGSALILGLVSLAVAYAYHRAARGEGTD
ncbi:MAG: DUF2339 domain-containing protein [Gemmatimonadales bacterium]